MACVSSPSTRLHDDPQLSLVFGLYSGDVFLKNALLSTDEASNAISLANFV